MPTLSAVPIKSPHIDRIPAGTKTWEIRSKNTTKTGTIALIRSRSGTVVGTATLAKVIQLTSPKMARENASRIGTDPETVEECVGCYAWVLDDVVALKTPVPYVHPSGAVTWVTLNEPVSANVLAEAKRSRQAQSRHTSSRI